ncbi:MAG: fasciclin domain-containing protein [Acidobacteriota bacterium]
MKDFGTGQGTRIQNASAGATLKINNATIVKPDIPASNGVIHIIDTVLRPPRLRSRLAARSRWRPAPC